MNLSKSVFIYVLLMSVFITSPAFAEGMTFGLVGKSINDGNFIDAWKGCDEAAKQSGDRCVLLGGDESNLRLQENAIKQAVKTKRFNAFAISVIRSDFVAKALVDVTVPVITFDSPLNEKHSHLSMAYVGADNIGFGRDIGLVTKQLHPEGKSVCIMTTVHDENLSIRVLGLRRELSKDSEFPRNKRLKGEGGWAENARCPWNAADRAALSLNQLGYTLATMKPDAFLAVGHWPIIDIPGFRKTVVPFRKEIKSKKTIIIIGIGTQSQEEVELLMNEGLVNGYVSIDFPGIGRKSYEVMKRLSEGKTVDTKNYIPNIIRFKD